MHTRQSPSYTEYAPLVVQPQPIHQWEAPPDTFTPPQYPPNRAQIIRTPSPTPSEQNQLEGKLPYSKGKMLKMYWRAYALIFLLFLGAYLRSGEALVAVIIIVAFIVIFAMNDKIVHALRPVKSWMDE